jgi:alanyl-tRNA synthetase
MNSSEIRNRFLKFFEKRGHKIIPSASLVPQNDPSVLFNTAGMQPLVPYLLGQEHPSGKRLVDVQKCVRTQDIDEVGDKTHDTFFEMLGNWSLGDYFKEEAIQWSFDLLTNKEEGFGLDVNRLYITVFEGDENAPRDTESFEIWKKVGIPENRIYFMSAKSNWWSAGDNGPCGPDSEMFYDLTGTLGDLTKEEYIKADDEQKVVEIWNDVFMEYEKKDGKVIGKLKNRNVDTGAVLERLAIVLQNKDNVFETDLFEPIISVVKNITTTPNEKAERVVSDHIRTAVFMIADGVTPSNTDRGYILRRLIRRAVRYSKVLNINDSLDKVVEAVQTKYKDIYPEVIGLEIQKIFSDEEIKFKKTLDSGLKQFEKGEDPFVLFTSYGFPIELSKELADEKGIKIDELDFKKKFEEHQELSRVGAEQKFKGGMAGNSEQEVRYHTATHLLHQALREVLGNEVGQKGSNITRERLRFDFTFPRKLTDEEKKKVEDIVNHKINQKLAVNKVVLPKEEAEKTGALHFFGDKYGESVSVYFVGDSIDAAWSKEFCGGPHVQNTFELAANPDGAPKHFKIQKEEAVSAGVRRIKAILE